MGICSVTGPLIESSFAALKFKQAVSNSFGANEILEINLLIESVSGVSAVSEMIVQAAGYATGLNFGHSNLRSSMLLGAGEVPCHDSDEFLDFLIGPAKKPKEAGLVINRGVLPALLFKRF